MRVRERLTDRSDVFAFEHKPSEINYGGHVRFHQAAFPPPLDGDPGFEQRLFDAVHRFATIIQARGEKGDLVFSLPQTDLADVFFDQWCETPGLRLTDYQDWVHRELSAVAESYRRLRLNAFQQERATGIPRLQYFVLLATTTLAAEIISGYFDQQIDRLGRLATMARFSLGRALAAVFRGVEAEEGVCRAREQKLGHAELDDASTRLLNPYLIAFLDSADLGLIEEALAGPNPYGVSQSLRARLMSFLGQLVVKSKAFEARNLKRALAEPGNLRRLLGATTERRRLLGYLRKQRDLRVQLVTENVLHRLRAALRTYLRTSLSAAPLAPFAANPKQLGEVLTRGAVRGRFLKALHGRRLPEADAVKAVLQEGRRQLARARRRWFFRLRTRDLLQECRDTLGRLSLFLTQSDDFQIVRSHYGQDTNQALEWRGLRLWRGFELRANGHTEGRPLVELERVWEKHQTEVQNSFSEGNIFLCRETGEIYPLSGQRRSRVVFLFADLRNSTETTMKLTKDTASFLAPYLTAVNSSARACEGQRIYFAGDGFAAFFLKASDALRAGYSISARFQKLRSLSGEKQIQKAKEILQAAQELKLDLRHPAKLHQALKQLDTKALQPEVHEFLRGLISSEEQTMSETSLRKCLARIASEYSMPRVDVGVALTSGELFYALVGEEDEDKIQIVISPQLTQAARLSGSSEAVKNHIEEHLPQPFPYNVFSWDQKLYNRGIAITEELFMQLQQEVDVRPLKAEHPSVRGEILHAYVDEQLNRRLILRENAEPVMLKGIEQPCRVYEVASLGSALDRLYGAPPAA